MEYKSPKELRNTAREIFIAARTRREQEFNEWKNGILKTPDEFRNKLPFDVATLTMQSLVPEWYSDTPNKEVCSEQIKAANEKLNAVNTVIEQYNQEGIKLLIEFNQEYKK